MPAPAASCGVRPAQPAERGDHDRRRRCARRVPGRYGERPGVGAIRLVARRRAQSHTVAAYSDTASTFGVDAAFENTSRRSNAPGEAGFGNANVIFERALGVSDASVRQELAGRSAITSSSGRRGALARDDAAVPDRRRSQSDRGKRIERARGRGLTRSALGDQRRLAPARGCRTRCRSAPARRCRRGCGWIILAAPEKTLLSPRLAASCFSARPGGSGGDRTVYAESRLREAGAKRLPRRSRQRRGSRCVSERAITARSASSRICRAASRCAPRATTNGSTTC